MSNDIRAMMDLIDSLERGDESTTILSEQAKVPATVEDGNAQNSLIMEGILGELLSDIEGITMNVVDNVISIGVPDAKRIDESSKVNKYSIVEARTLFLDDMDVDVENIFNNGGGLTKTITLGNDDRISDSILESVLTLLRSEIWSTRTGKHYNTLADLKESMQIVDIKTSDVLGVKRSVDWHPSNLVYTPIIVEAADGKLWSIFGGNELAILSNSIDTFKGLVV